MDVARILPITREARSTRPSALLRRGYFDLLLLADWDQAGIGFLDASLRRYAKQHLNTDPGVREVYYRPADAPVRDIRFVEVNEWIADRNDDTLEPVDFGVDMGAESAHRLFVLDVTLTNGIEFVSRPCRCRRAGRWRTLFPIRERKNIQLVATAVEQSPVYA